MQHLQPLDLAVFHVARRSDFGAVAQPQIHRHGDLGVFSANVLKFGLELAAGGFRGALNELLAPAIPPGD